MSPDKGNHSVFDEPHMRPGHSRADRSEVEADQTLRRESARASDDCADGHSVFDEPDIFPGRADEVVDQDWSCTNCGYNLRGLPTHHPCPECGHKELYRPAPPGSSSYQSWLRRRIEATSPTRAWTVALLLAVCGGPWAIFAALLDASNAGGGLLMLMVVLAPVVEETMKIAAAAWVVEVRPYLFRRVEQLQVATVGSALVFAAIENVLYLNVYNPNPTLLYTIWRWTVCVALHMGCTLLATRGLAAVWRRCTTELRPPRLTQGIRWLVIAIIVHASYNAAAAAWAWMR